MHRSSRLAARVLGVWLCGAVSSTVALAGDFVFQHDNVMGTSLDLRVRADNDSAAHRAEGRVLREIDRLAAIFSNHDPSSEFRRWLATTGGPVGISPELFEVLHASERWRARSGGVFEPGVQILSRLWAESAGKGRTPAPEALADALAILDHPAWRLDFATQSAERLTDAPLSLDAIAKGFILERAAEVAWNANDGVGGLLLNVGGDLLARGEAAQTVAIAAPTLGSEGLPPIALVEVRDQALATSGHHHRGFEINDRHYSHILDPRTGHPADAVAQATVIARRSADADALATILNVLTPEEGVKLIESIPDADCLIVGADGRLVRSAGWQGHERPSPMALAQAGPPTPEGWWGDAFELEVDIEVNRPDDGPRYRRPYVAIWVENQDGFPVRTLALWVSTTGGGPSQWLPDLKRWYRSDEARKRVDNRQMVLAWAQPTRPPGKYAVLWDGKDSKDRPVPPGDYTIFIEAAREHGTYQSIRQAVTIADVPFAEELQGNVEIRAASIEYRRKTPAK